MNQARGTSSLSGAPADALMGPGSAPHAPSLMPVSSQAVTPHAVDGLLVAPAQGSGGRASKRAAAHRAANTLMLASVGDFSGFGGFNAGDYLCKHDDDALEEPAGGRRGAPTRDALAGLGAGGRDVDAEEARVEDEQDDKCCVCGLGDSDDNNQIVLCDGCDIAVHQACYGIRDIPEGDWFCALCESGAKGSRIPCALCPNMGGAMVRTACGKWCHTACALFIPGPRFVDPESMNLVDDLGAVDPRRFKLACGVCNRRGTDCGAAVQCSRQSCRAAFHVTCALLGGVHISLDDDGDAGGRPASQRLLCPRHLPVGHTLPWACPSRACSMPNRADLRACFACGTAKPKDAVCGVLLPPPTAASAALPSSVRPARESTSERPSASAATAGNAPRSSRRLRSDSFSGGGGVGGRGALGGIDEDEGEFLVLMNGSADDDGASGAPPSASGALMSGTGQGGNSGGAVGASGNHQSMWEDVVAPYFRPLSTSICWMLGRSGPPPNVLARAVAAGSTSFVAGIAVGGCPTVGHDALTLPPMGPHYLASWEAADGVTHPVFSGWNEHEFTQLREELTLTAGKPDSALLEFVRARGLCPDTVFRAACDADAPILFSLNTVNPIYDSPDDYLPGRLARNELVFVAQRKSSGAVVGFVNFFLRWFNGHNSGAASAATMRPQRCVYVAILQVARPAEHPGREPMNYAESRTGSVLLALALQSAKAVGMHVAYADATLGSTDFYRAVFGMELLPARTGHDFQPVTLDLTRFNAGVPLRYMNPSAAAVAVAAARAARLEGAERAAAAAAGGPNDGIKSATSEVGSPGAGARRHNARGSGEDHGREPAAAHAGSPGPGAGLRAHAVLSADCGGPLPSVASSTAAAGAGVRNSIRIELCDGLDSRFPDGQPCFHLARDADQAPSFTASLSFDERWVGQEEAATGAAAAVTRSLVFYPHRANTAAQSPSAAPLAAPSFLLAHVGVPPRGSAFPSSPMSSRNLSTCAQGALEHTAVGLASVQDVVYTHIAEASAKVAETMPDEAASAVPQAASGELSQPAFADDGDEICEALRALAAELAVEISSNVARGLAVLAAAESAPGVGDTAAVVKARGLEASHAATLKAFASLTAAHRADVEAARLRAEADLGASCVVCGDEGCEHGNQIVFCEACDMAVHQACYGVPVIPDGDWFCDPCGVARGDATAEAASVRQPPQCVLCPVDRGALKPTACSQWVHVICALYYPGARFLDPRTLQPVVLTGGELAFGSGGGGAASGGSGDDDAPRACAPGVSMGCVSMALCEPSSVIRNVGDVSVVEMTGCAAASASVAGDGPRPVEAKRTSSCLAPPASLFGEIMSAATSSVNTSCELCGGVQGAILRCAHGRPIPAAATPLFSAAALPAPSFPACNRFFHVSCAAAAGHQLFPRPELALPPHGASELLLAAAASSAPTLAQHLPCAVPTLHDARSFTSGAAPAVATRVLFCAQHSAPGALCHRLQSGRRDAAGKQAGADALGSRAWAPKPKAVGRGRCAAGAAGLSMPLADLAACRKLLASLRRSKLVEPFINPVHPVLDNVPDYLDVIKDPVDLGLVRARLDGGGYSSAAAFVSDVRRVFSNAIHYHGRGGPNSNPAFVGVAQALLQKVDALMVRVCGALQAPACVCMRVSESA